MRPFAFAPGDTNHCFVCFIVILRYTIDMNATKEPKKSKSNLSKTTEVKFNFDATFTEMKKNNWNYAVLPHLVEIEKHATQQQRGQVALWLIEQEPSVFDTTVEIFCCNYIKDSTIRKMLIDFCNNNDKITERRKKRVIEALNSDKEIGGYK